jgi:predicted RNase H-like HicB family nuclease
MTVPVWVEQNNGTFTASVPGMPQLRSTAATKDQAVAALVATLTDRQTRGELILVNLPPAAPPLQCSEAESEAWDEIVEEIYRHRAELKAQEFPE